MTSKTELMKFLIEHMAAKTSETVMTTWFGDAELLRMDEDRVFIRTTSEFKKGILVTHYTEIVKSSLRELFGTEMEVDFVIDEPPKTADIESFVNHSDLDFDHFVIGESNKFAAYAAMSVAKAPGEDYNPLLIYGDSGLGKTHLLFAILNYTKKHHPEYTVQSFTAESFTNDLMFAMRMRTQEDFREKYRTADMILVDDIQFISRTDFSQEEFFHTFNALQQRGRQIVITSDRPPKDMALLEERLRTRFTMGLLVDIKPPDIETRKEIILSKARRLGLQLPGSVVDLIAQTITENVRQIEGSVKKLVARRDIFGNITLEDAQLALSDLIQENPGLNPTPDYILRKVCEYFSLDEKIVTGSSQQASAVRARHIAMYLMRMMTEVSFADIGRNIFRKDHTTVMSGVTKIEKKRLNDPALNAQVEALIDNIKGK